MKKLFGTDGIRGIAGSELDFTLTYRVGLALTTVLINQGIKLPKIIIGMDTRESSPMLCSAITNGIREGGGKSTSIGICSTPAVAYHLVRHHFDAGVMISASHNPYEYNGIKIFGRDGYKISDEMEERIEALVFEERLTEESANEEYIDYLKGAFGIPLDGLKVGVDCANGSASVTAYDVFSSLGAECYMLSDRPDGKNINHNCGSTCLEGLKRFVIDNNLDVGIAFDGDADRCLAIDENGQEIDGDFILAILSLRMIREKKLNKNAIVGTVMTNLGLRKFCEENGIVFKSASVGDRFVLEMLRNDGLSLGGEQSGHIILPELSTTGDGQLTAVALLSEMKKSEKKLSELAKVMTKYPQVTINIEAHAFEKQSFLADEEIKRIILEAESELLGNGRLIVRPSGTEPLIRISAESETKETAEKICQDVAEKIKGRLKELKTTV